jgi:catechol 2,3-dioxygenase-like lactoylglutathione lyase family enzyme
MAKLIHAMIRVRDEESSKRFYREALGLDREERFAFDGFTLVYLRNEAQEFEIELTINHGRAEPYTHGDGYGHLAIVVDDLDADQGVRARRCAVCPLLLRQGPGRLQDRGAATARPLSLTATKSKT